jgi:hypothetical protein
MEVTGNKIIRQNFIVNLADELKQDCIRPRDQQQFLNKVHLQHVPIDGSVKLLNIERIKLTALAFHAKKELVVLLHVKLQNNIYYYVNCISEEH